jgi:thioredoxin reductase (NADPH)
VKGKKVLIVGGGDAAFENALILSKFASSVTVAFRKPTPSARREFVDAAALGENIRLLPSTVLDRISGDDVVEVVELTNHSGEARIEDVDAVLIRIGVVPNSEIVQGIVDLDDCLYIKVDQTGATSVRGIYAVGDVANPCSPTLSTAVGTGATAAKAIFRSFKNANAL